MFFSPQILINKNSNFALIWRYMHDGRRKTKTRGELLDLDVTRACEDLLTYIPSGHLNVVELKTKMSLYLLGQLFYGIVLVHQLQVNSYEVDVRAAAKCMLRVSEPEKKAPRKRAANEDKTVAEELIKDDAPKKKRASKQRMPSLLDLNDPSAYVEDRPLRQITTEPFVGTDDNFGEPMGTHARRSQTFMEIEAELRRSAQRENEPLETDVELREPKVSAAWLSLNHTPERAREPSTPHFDVSGLAPPVKRSLYEAEEINHEQQFVPPQPIQDTLQAPADVPIYRQSIDPNLIPISQLSQDEMFLGPLPIKTEPGIRKKKGRKHLIIDDQMVISSEEMMQQINDYSSLIKTHEALVEEYERARRPSIAQLLNPRPLNWQILGEDLYPLFDKVLKNVRERPLTFEEASKLGFEELRRRRFDFDLYSWHSAEPVNVEPPLEEQINNKVSTAEIVLSPLGEDYLLSAEANRPSSIEPARRFERSNMFEEPDFDQRLVDDVNMSRPLEADQFNALQISRVVSPPRELETTAVSTGEETDKDILYEQIVSRHKRVMTFSEVIGPVSKQVAIKKFITLLHLLKRECYKSDAERIKVKQTEPYGNILIKFKVLVEPE